MTLLIYLLKTMAIQAVAYLSYRLLFDQEPWGNLKRFYLLGALLFSFVLPFLPSGLPPEAVEQVAVILPQVTVLTGQAHIASTTVSPGVSGWQLLMALGYLLGLSYGLFRLTSFLLKIKKQLADATSLEPGFVRLVALPYATAPHTFWRWVFYDEGSQPAPEILIHERAHARQLHSLDRLLIAVLRAIFWFNPVLYWYDLAIRENHELLADRAVLRAGWDPTSYQQRLLSALTAINGAPHLSSGAGFALTKKRFQMMYTSSSHWSRSLAKLTAVGFLWVALLIGFGERGFAQAPPPPPPPPVPASDATPPPGVNGEPVTQTIPTAEQLRAWAKSSTNISIDFKKISNAELASRNPEEFSQYYYGTRHVGNNNYVKGIILFTQKTYPWPNVPPPPPPPPIAPPDWSTIAPKVPTASQWQSWQVPTEYGVWIDDRRVDNNSLKDLSPADFSYYSISKLARNAVNFGKHTYQLNLMTKEKFEKLQKQ